MRVVSSSIFFVAMAVLPSACLEMPVHRITKTENPIVDLDAGDDGGPSAAELCRACIAAPEDPGPGCKTPHDVCMANGMCKAMIQCAFDDRCFLGPQRNFLTCAIPCLEKAGVDNMNAEVLTTASTLFQCLANGPCGNFCFTHRDGGS
jgi:hypothetical protein